MFNHQLEIGCPHQRCWLQGWFTFRRAVSDSLQSHFSDCQTDHFFFASSRDSLLVFSSEKLFFFAALCTCMSLNLEVRQAKAWSMLYFFKRWFNMCVCVCVFLRSFDKWGPVCVMSEFDHRGAAAALTMQVLKCVCLLIYTQHTHADGTAQRSTLPVVISCLWLAEY